MALPTTVTASGAGSSGDNGTYSLSSGTDAHGNHYYAKGSGGSARYIYYATSGGYWIVGSVLNAVNGYPPSFTTDDYYSPSGQVATTFPLTSWVRNSFNSSSSAPAPSFVSPITAVSVMATSGYVSDYGVNAGDASLTNAPAQYDGNYTSGGNANTGGRISVIWDLGSTIAISQVNCWMSTTSGYQVSWSTDGTTWSTDAIQNTSGAAHTLSVSARYIRFNNYGSGPVTVWETAVYDSSGGPVIGPPTGGTLPDAPPAPSIGVVTSSSITVGYGAPAAGCTNALQAALVTSGVAGTPSVLVSGITAAGSYLHSGLASGATYEYSLVATNSFGSTSGPVVDQITNNLHASTDSAVGTDTISATATIPVTDAGAGTDTPVGGLRNPIGDGAIGTDTISVTVGRPTIEAGTTATFPGLGASTRLSLPGLWEIDYGSIDVGDSFVPDDWLVSYAAGNFTITVPPSTTPTIGSGTFFSAYYQAAPGAAPVYLAFDTTAPALHIAALTDSAVGTDSTAGTGRYVDVSDNATGTDTAGMSATVGFVDGAVGSDAGIGPSQGINVTDSAAGTDTADVAGFLMATQELGAGFERMEAQNVTDGTSTSAAAGYDYGQGGDVMGVTAIIEVLDGAVGTDVMDLAAPPIIGVTDGAVGTDAASAPAKSLGYLTEAILN